MISSLSLFIGLRFSRGCRRNSIITLITLSAVISITIGVSIFIISLSAINGFEKELNNQILAIIPHGEIESLSQPWKNWNESLKKIEKIPDITSVIPYISFSALAKNGTNWDFIQLKGINLKTDYINTLSKYIKKNILLAFKAKEKQIIIGKGIADSLKVKEGDWISIMMSSKHTDYKFQYPKNISLHVTGILQLNGQFSHNIALIPLEDARVYLHMVNSITGLIIKVNDIFSANKIIIKVSEIINNNIYVKSWIDTYGYMYQDIQMIRSIIYLTIILVIVIACFNIISTTITAVKNKNIEIAILLTLGAKNNLIHSIFIWYGFLIGIIGNVLGLIIGITISFKLTSIFDKIEKFIGHRFLSKNIYFIDFLPSELHWSDIVYIVVITLLLSLVSSWYPVYQASDINITRILNNKKF